MSRACWFGFAAFVLLAAEAAPARADIGPGPSPSVNRPLRNGDALPQPVKVLPDGSTVPDQFPPRPEPRRRTGPFRSCGSGAGTGLAAIGVSWGLLWLGTRFAGLVRGTRG